MTFDGETFSLDPSIGNWSFPCQSHYWVCNNRVRRSTRWSAEKIAAGRARDRAATERRLARDREGRRPRPSHVPDAAGGRGETGAQTDGDARSGLRRGTGAAAAARCDRRPGRAIRPAPATGPAERDAQVAVRLGHHRPLPCDRQGVRPCRGP
ncbi:DUF6527 family protein [Nonomuraea angiospora]